MGLITDPIPIPHPSMGIHIGISIPIAAALQKLREHRPTPYFVLYCALRLYRPTVEDITLHRCYINCNSQPSSSDHYRLQNMAARVVKADVIPRTFLNELHSVLQFCKSRP